MTPAELDIDGPRTGPRANPRKAALDALERLLRGHVALSEERQPEGDHGLLRPAREDEVGLIESVFLHCGVPLPDTLRAIYRRTLGVGNPVSRLPVLAVPFLRAALPDEGFGCPAAGLVAFEERLGLHRDETTFERPPFLHLGHAAPLGLTVSRNGLWSLADYQGFTDLPRNEEFGLVFESAFRTFADQVLLLWANDLAGDPLGRRDLDLTRGARLSEMPASIREAHAHLVAPRTIGLGAWGDVQPLDSADLLRATQRGAGSPAPGPLGAHVAVVGLPYGDRPEVAARIGPGTVLRLRPVDDNPHDPNAVEVWLDEEVPLRVGFVERREAPRLRDLPQGAPAWRLRVAGRTALVLLATLEMRDEAGPSGENDLPAGEPSPDLDLFSRG